MWIKLTSKRHSHGEWLYPFVDTFSSWRVVTFHWCHFIFYKYFISRWVFHTTHSIRSNPCQGRSKESSATVRFAVQNNCSVFFVLCKNYYILGDGHLVIVSTITRAQISLKEIVSNTGFNLKSISSKFYGSSLSFYTIHSIRSNPCLRWSKGSSPIVWFVV